MWDALFHSSPLARPSLDVKNGESFQGGKWPMIRARESKSAPVGVVGKVLRILEALDASPNGLQLREISQQTRVNKSTAYRFVAHLEKEGYLFRDVAGAYIVGPKLARLGAGVAFTPLCARLGGLSLPLCRTRPRKPSISASSMDMMCSISM